MSDPTPGLTSVSFTCAYWDFLRGHRAEPLPEKHGLTPAVGVVLCSQIKTEFAEVQRQSARLSVQLAVAS